ncbi:MAG: lipopolysaccharide biosynthesis protein, partial [Candidatus Hodarchaeota archaeon]
MLNDFLKDLTKYFPSLAVPIIVELIALPIITRLFSPGDYGNYILVKSSVLIMTILTTAWFSSSLTRFFPEFELKNKINIFNGTIIMLAVTAVCSISSLTAVIFLLLRSRISNTFYSLLWVGLLLFVIFSFFDIFTKLLRAKRRPLEYSLFRIWYSVMGLVIGLTLIKLFHLDIKGLLWGLTISAFTSLPFLWISAIGKFPYKGISNVASITLELAKFGVPATGIYLLSWIQSLSDRYIIGFFRSSEDVGIYS